MNGGEALNILEDMVVNGRIQRLTGRGRTTKAILYRTLSGRAFGLEMGNAKASVEDLPGENFRLVVGIDAKPAARTQIVMQKDVATAAEWQTADRLIGVTLRKRQLKSTGFKADDAALEEGQQQVAYVDTPAALYALLKWYDGNTTQIEGAALQRLRERFLALFPDFQSFDQASTFDRENADKRRLIAALGADADDRTLNAASLGEHILDHLMDRGGIRASVLDQYMVEGLAKRRDDSPGVLEEAAGRLARADDRVAAVDAFVSVCTSAVIGAGREGVMPLSNTRRIPSVIVALLEPGRSLAIAPQRFTRAARALLGTSILGNGPLTAAELGQANAFARQLFAIMRDDWHWNPRDLWDVHGFLWVTCDSELNAADTNESLAMKELPVSSKPNPTNLILYGPPGTGKTYYTAMGAVRLCDGLSQVEANQKYPADSAGRRALRERYLELRDKEGQLEFVTFHQSYSYEDFVEGLRPETGTGSDMSEGDENGAGFRLVPRDGIFKRICALAEQERQHPSTGTQAIDFGDASFWKMGLGAIGKEDDVFDAAMRDGYIALGWGGEIDWSGDRFTTAEAIKRQYLATNPENKQPSNWIQTHCFRNGIKIGDFVIVPYGNTQFRAVGRVSGEYYFDASTADYYPHRRDVKWFAGIDLPLPLSAICDTKFSTRTLYSLPKGDLNTAALSRLLSGSAGAAGQANSTAAPRQFVLIIDEINRANISKVFGELITLIEPDKRLGMPEELAVKLPHSDESKFFGVPSNLHIIGTMNTADRSIALLDTALRRRFTFREMAPQSELLKAVGGVDLAAVLRTINQRVEYLIDREHRIGHAFFMGCETLEAVNAAMRDKVIPLLQEYFFEDWGRIHAVLGGGFIGKTTLLAPPTLQGESRDSWFVQAGPWTANTYLKLLKGIPAEPHADNDEAPDMDAIG